MKDTFHTPAHLISSDHLTIEGEESAHIIRVLRKSIGESICVVDGAGRSYDATIEIVGKKSIECRITGRHEYVNEPTRHVTLAVCLLKNSSRYDYLVEKTTEIGINSIVPIISERTIPRSAKIDRWQKIALAAMKQSGRSVLPRIPEPITFEQFVRSADPHALRFIPHEKIEGGPLHHAIPEDNASPIILCIGPEGGFSETEILVAEENGFAAVSLGNRRLRTETAAIAAAVLVLAT